MANAYTDEKGVFKNLLGQSDASALQVAEYRITRARSMEIVDGRVELNVSGFGLERQVAIHKHLFQDVYEWAGKIRTVPSSKRAEFAHPLRGLLRSLPGNFSYVRPAGARFHYFLSNP